MYIEEESKAEREKKCELASIIHTLKTQKRRGSASSSSGRSLPLLLRVKDGAALLEDAASHCLLRVLYCYITILCAVLGIMV